MIVLVLLKIKFGHAQITLPKIGIPMLKTACINPSPYSCARDTQTIVSELKSISNKLFHRFQYNHLKANPRKCHLLLSSKTPTDASIGDASLATRTKETLLGILIDSELGFDEHVKLARNYMFQDALLPLLIKVFVKSQFSNCPLIWMLHSKIMNKKINRIHERALRLVCSDYISSFSDHFLYATGTFEV